jgi:hypothetical protein
MSMRGWFKAKLRVTQKSYEGVRHSLLLAIMAQRCANFDPVVPNQ